MRPVGTSHHFITQVQHHHPHIKTPLPFNGFTLLWDKDPGKLLNSHYPGLQVEVWTPPSAELPDTRCPAQVLPALPPCTGTHREVPASISAEAQTLVTNMPGLDPKSFAHIWNGNYAFTKDSLHPARYTYVQISEVILSLGKSFQMWNQKADFTRTPWISAAARSKTQQPI